MQMMGYSYAYRIVMARSGLVAVERVKRCRDTDLVVVEYRLPAMSDSDVMKEIKDVAPSILVLIVTAYGDEEVEAFRSGARNYLKKPNRKNILPEPDAPALLGTQLSTVTLSQYHKIQQTVRFINDNYRADICLDAVAGEASMSPSQFSRIFKKVMGVPCQDYLNGRRITKAKYLLRNIARSVTEITVFLCFADPTWFGVI